MKKGMRKETEQNYLNVFYQIWNTLMQDANSNLQTICIKNKVSHNLPSMMCKVGILKRTKNGIMWIDTPPNRNQVKRVYEYKSNYNQSLKESFNQTKIEFKEPKKRIVVKNDPAPKGRTFEFKLFGLSIIKIAR